MQPADCKGYINEKESLWPMKEGVGHLGRLQRLREAMQGEN